MKRLICLLILPLMAIFCFTGCNEDKTIGNVKDLYKEMIELDKGTFFSDDTKPNTIVIAYEEDILNAIKAQDPTTDIMKRYVAIGKQQTILNNVFNYYEKNSADFYTKMSSATYSASDINELYNKLDELKKELNSFRTDYNTFVENTAGKVSQVMPFSLINYSYKLNVLIEKSFDFMYNFMGLYTKYCTENYNVNSPTNLSLRIDKAYVDLSYVVYYENFKSFNYSVGSKGVCDLDKIINSSSDFEIIDNIELIKTLSNDVLNNQTEGSTRYNEIQTKLKEFVYAQDLFDQKISIYIQTYNSIDFYTLNQHRMGLVADLDYDRYVDSLTETSKADVLMLNNFIQDIYGNYVEKLNVIVA